MGGVPVIKPGFEYTLEIIDDRQEAVSKLKERFPEKEYKPQYYLMKVVDDGEVKE